MKSWHTSLAGIGAILTALGNAMTAQFDADLTTEPQWGIVVALSIAALGLVFARDNKVNDEQSGAKSSTTEE